MTRLLLLTVYFAVAACSQPEQPALSEPAPVPPVEAGASPSGPDAGNFVGTWAVQAGACGSAQGAERPIRITTARFEGHENSCAIEQVRQVSSAYEAVLSCTGEGATAQERVRMRVVGDRLTLSWLDRAGSTSTTFARCPAQTAPGPIPMPVPPAPEPTG